MKWFDTYTSNTLGAGGNQLIFSTEGKTMTGRIYYKVFSGGTHEYSLLFSNIMDSTYKFGEESCCNKICDEWELYSARIGVCKTASTEKAVEPEHFFPLTFSGAESKHVSPAEFFTSDPITLTAEKGDFLCYEVTYCGTMIPYHWESILPIFVKDQNTFVPDKRVPIPGMIGCNRPVKKRIGFLGDSITQGVGTPDNAYTHWNALISDAIGDDYSYWNLGIGYGKGQDAASDGAWLFKAKQNDAVVVAYGSNDVGRGRSVEGMREDFAKIVQKLKAEGIKVFLISVPPFDWQDEYLERWLSINEILRHQLSKEADGFFDIAPLLVDYTQWEGKSKYEKHPNEEGCRIWADNMLPLMKEFLKKL